MDNLLFSHEAGTDADEHYIQNIFNCNDTNSQKTNINKGGIESEGAFRLDFEIERCYDLVE